MSDKIKISWDDLKTDSIDKKVKQQEVFERVRIHQEEVMRNAPPLPGRVPPPLPGALPMGAAGVAGGSIWMKSVVYLALFGLLGGFLAWIAGEAIQQPSERNAREFSAFVAFLHQYENEGMSPYRTRQIIQENAGHNRYFAAMNRHGENSRESIDEVNRIRDEQAKKSENASMHFFASCGMLIAMFLAMAEAVVSRNAVAALKNAALGAVIGSFGGGFLSAFIDPLYQALGGGSGSSFGTQMFARAVAWAIAGCFLAIAPGILMQSGKKLVTGLVGGFLGGLIGGLLFDPVGMVTDSATLSRFFGIVGIGVLSGVGIGLLENALKSGWLKVLVGPITGKQFIIYRNPTRIGSSPQSEIYLFKDPTISPTHAAITLSGGGFMIENIGTGTTYVNGTPVTKKKLALGDEIAIGNTRLLFEGKR